MQKSIQSVFMAFVVLVVLLSGCAPASTPFPTPVPATLTPSPIPPTFTPEPTVTFVDDEHPVGVIALGHSGMT
ncbi:MAG TPA: hypothetical protein VIR02_08135, partial [Anaerolineales bacterium]